MVIKKKKVIIITIVETCKKKTMIEKKLNNEATERPVYDYMHINKYIPLYLHNMRY